MKCECCKKKIEGNPVFIVKYLTRIGYLEINFCSVNCYVKRVIKKYGKYIK